MAEITDSYHTENTFLKSWAFLANAGTSHVWYI